METHRSRFSKMYLKTAKFEQEEEDRKLHQAEKTVEIPTAVNFNN
jgi:hypothetical protein